MVASFARVNVGGVDVRASKEPAPAHLVRSYEIASGYPVFVDGELRGVLVYCTPGWRSYTHRGWALKSLADDYAATSHWPKARACKELLEKVPALIAENRLPDAATVAERERIAAERRAKEEAERPAREAAELRKRERDAQRRAEEEATFQAGMRSIRARPDLTNLERVAIERAFWRLHIDEEEPSDG